MLILRQKLQRPAFAMALLSLLFVAGLSISPYDFDTQSQDVPGDEVLEIYVTNAATQDAVSTNTEVYFSDIGIENAMLIIEAPCTLPVGETLTASAVVKNAPDGLSCSVKWYMDDVLLIGRAMTTGSPPQDFSYAFSYNPDMPASVSLRAEVIYITPNGYEQTLTADKIIAVENHDFEYWFDLYAEHVMNKVTSEYTGDYTTQYALSNDLSDFEKEVWINAGDFTSRTDYIIWINIAYQRVNIFSRPSIESLENAGIADTDRRWELIRTCLVSTGAPRTPTPPGTFYVNGKQEDGWHLTSYVVRPVVNFSAGVNYGFHSRLYYPDSDELYDDSIGYPISRGCVRMLDEDIEFIFANIPAYTTVVVN